MTSQTVIIGLASPSGATTLKLDGTNGTAKNFSYSVKPALITKGVPARAYRIGIHTGYTVSISISGIFEDYDQMEDFLGYAESWNHSSDKYTKVLFEYETSTNKIRTGYIKSASVKGGGKEGWTGADFTISITKMEATTSQAATLFP